MGSYSQALQAGNCGELPGAFCGNQWPTWDKPRNMLAHTACQGDFHEGPTACFQKLPSDELLKKLPMIYFSVVNPH